MKRSKEWKNVVHAIEMGFGAAFGAIGVSGIFVGLTPPPLPDRFVVVWFSTSVGLIILSAALLIHSQVLRDQYINDR